MTQTQQVIDQLDKFGRVSRNWCLQNYISRLGAIICDLKKEGYEFTSRFVKTPEGGKDYVYYKKEVKIAPAPLKTPNSTYLDERLRSIARDLMLSGENYKAVELLNALKGNDTTKEAYLKKYENNQRRQYEANG